MQTFICKTLCLCWLLAAACRKGDDIVPPVVSQLEPPQENGYAGFYLLNEANMGSNKSTLDYYDYTTGRYNKNIYATVNPTAVKELGDVGNDIRIYGGKIYAVINVSGKVEVMDAYSAKRLGQIDIPNCRYLAFANGKAYVSSYAGPVIIDPAAPIGYVAEVDTVTLKVGRKVIVGYQPEEMAVVNGKLYVANSGGYRVPDYDRTVSVIDLATFTEIKKIGVAINLHRLKADAYGDVYVSSRGDYYDVRPSLHVIDTRNDVVKKSLDVPASNLCIAGDTVYIYGSAFSYQTHQWTVSYSMLDVRTETVLPGSFITDGTERDIRMPYGIAVHPVTRDIYVTDARDYVSPGTLYCFDKAGKKKWSVTTGDIPAHFAFLPKR
ncbi:DUF5074 domain-containing protein [Chitinophaga lutea]